MKPGIGITAVNQQAVAVELEKILADETVLYIKTKNAHSYHAGDGGMVAVIKDEQNNIIATTNKNWKAQTFYTAPIVDLSCVEERGNIRYSENCDDSGGQDGTAFYTLHWEVPANWTMPNFDAPSNDASFIWSTNVVLDNEVLVRYTIK